MKVILCVSDLWELSSNIITRPLWICLQQAALDYEVSLKVIPANPIWAVLIKIDLALANRIKWFNVLDFFSTLETLVKIDYNICVLL